MTCGPSVCSWRAIPPSSDPAKSAVLTEFFHPAAKHVIVRRLDVYEFHSHADPWFYDSNGPQGLQLLILASQRDPDARAPRERLAGAHKKTPHGNVGGDAFGPRPGFQVHQLHIGGKRVANRVPAIADAEVPRLALSISFWHGYNVLHDLIFKISG